ncbi:hypothetical protein GCM10023191_018370 [Actinoallomurus oryzae]|jgi:hypothetical protein|uniref:Uncharacterized protein n=1 Tax=Actinoallomurus oryzae TaxID=502180 RepID=A0ABP8PLC0_9ACTN
MNRSEMVIIAISSHSCIAPDSRDRIGTIHIGCATGHTIADPDGTVRTASRFSVVKLRLALTRIPPAKMTKEIQQPLPGFGKSIAHRFFAHTLSVTLRDNAQATEPDEWGGIVAHTPQPSPASSHVTSPALV